MCLTSIAIASALAASCAAIPAESAVLPTTAATPVTQNATSGGPATAEISILTYNIRGLPWPLASGRAQALKTIGRELAQMRREGRQPDVVLIQEGFRGEVADLVKASGYPHWARGPSRSRRASGSPPGAQRPYRAVRYLASGEGWGKFTGSGLHVLSDLPIIDIQSAAYSFCAGLDCLANKGVMLARLAVPGVPTEVDVVNTHMNSKRAAKVPLARSLHAHKLQTDELMAFIADKRAIDSPLLVGGDFNVKGAPDRYGYRAEARPYKVVSEFCSDRGAGCEGQTFAAEAKPWLRSQDLQAFISHSQVNVRPVRVETLFGAASPTGRLSDHEGYLVRYRLSWSPAPAESSRARAPVEVRPKGGPLGVKVSWKP